MLSASVSTLSFLGLAALAAGSPVDLQERQSGTTSTWSENCYTGSRATPSNFKVFNVGSCQAQLSFIRDTGHVGFGWKFQAVYADGSRSTIAPFTDNGNFGVADPFYCVNYGNNKIVPADKNFTSVHEFQNVCRGSAAPVAWAFVLPGDSKRTCLNGGRTFTSGDIRAVSGTRPGKPAITSARRGTNSPQTLDVSWSRVSGAAQYSVLGIFPTYSSEVGEVFYGVRGAKRIFNPDTTSTTVIGPSSSYLSGNPRRVIVHAVNAAGVWSQSIDQFAVTAV